MRLGAHVSTSGGMVEAVRQGLELDCEAIQVFTRNQRQWTPKPLEPTACALFRDEAKTAGYERDAVSHASYLINLASEDPQITERSLTAFIDEIERCALLGVPYLCFHPGSHLGAGEEVGLERVAERVREALKATRGKRVKILIENTAGQGTNLGNRLEHLQFLVRRIRSQRIGVCIDTCHLFAAGYDIRTPKAYEKTLGELDSLVGLERILAFHLNDSQHDLGSRKDRHANIGQGAIGEKGFRLLMRESAFENVPGLLETPGAPEGYRQDLALLRKFRKK